MYDVTFARKKIKKQLEKLDKITISKIFEGIEEIRKSPYCGKALTGDLNAYYSYRRGMNRIVYSVTIDKIIIMTVNHRNGVYKDLKRFL